MRASLRHTPERRPAQTVTLPDELAAVLADEDSPGLPARLAPVFRALNATENGLVSTRRPAWEWADTSMAIRRTAAPPGD